ncbi:MAG TPA: DUF2911 domain-containing protein [Cyclobacteriaceae bacterium]|nr:DUF2911 domain-containing protein [Cyclobacteriaceae bacterium]
MKKGLIIIAILAVILVAAFLVLRNNAKSKSPEAGVEFVEGDLKITVFYNAPSKKGRVIFADDGLVPFGKVWRTGANEATYIETNKTLIFQGKELKPGKYSLWTIPTAQSWTVIFNTDYPGWGINFNGEANHDPNFDVVTVEVPAVIQDTEFEMFTISVERINDEELELDFLWDKTLVAVPFTVAAQ